MSRHKWRKGALPQLCEKCGMIRSRESKKILMAITGSQHHYQYKTVIVYSTPERKYDKAPKCQP